MAIEPDEELIHKRVLIHIHEIKAWEESQDPPISKFSAVVDSVDLSFIICYVGIYLYYGGHQTLGDPPDFDTALLDWDDYVFYLILEFIDDNFENSMNPRSDIKLADENDIKQAVDDWVTNNDPTYSLKYDGGELRSRLNNMAVLYS